ncbi:hypothetical protein C0992_009123 [Termitomyces sp. T32_za158]|nr:hypothetical protein C0992_009123 [Termitomyces sp. T32_za158]
MAGPHDFVSVDLDGLIHPDLANFLFAVYDKTKVSETGNANFVFAGAIGYSNSTVQKLTAEIAWVLISPKFQHAHVSTVVIGLSLKYTLDFSPGGKEPWMWTRCLRLRSTENRKSQGCEKDGV